jgi:hypothetical protein
VLRLAEGGAEAGERSVGTDGGNGEEDDEDEDDGDDAAGRDGRWGGGSGLADQVAAGGVGEHLPPVELDSDGVGLHER